MISYNVKKDRSLRNSARLSHSGYCGLSDEQMDLETFKKIYSIIYKSDRMIDHITELLHQVGGYRMRNGYFSENKRKYSSLRKAFTFFIFASFLGIFSSFSIRSLYLKLTGNLVPQPVPKLNVSSGGSLTSNVEIPLPPGRKGIAPRLAFSYSSGSRSGLLGIGWDIEGIPSILRDSGFGIRYDGTDDFLSTQAGQLTDVSGNRSVFHSRKESWLRFVPGGVCGDGPCSWLVTDKDGIEYSFGATSDSRIEAIGRNGSVRAWALDQVRDSFGNGYNISYIEDSVDGEYVPKEIVYQNRKIVFEYNDDRSDTVPSFLSGSLVKNSRLLDSVKIYVDGSIIREFGLSYSKGSLSNRPVLSAISRRESNVFGSEEFADLEFTYGSDGFVLKPISNIDLKSTSSLVNVFVPSGLLLYANLLFQNPLPSEPSAQDRKIADYLQYVMHMPVPERDSCNIGPAACICAAYAPCWGGNADFFNQLVSSCLDYNNWGGPQYCSGGIEAGLTNWMQLDANGDGLIDFASVVGSETFNNIRLRVWTVSEGKVDSDKSFLSPVLPLHYNTFSRTVDLDGDGRTDFAYENGGKLNAILSKGTYFSDPKSFSNVNIPAANRNMTVFAPYSYLYEPSETDSKRLAPDKAPADWFADMDGDGLSDFIHYDGSYFNIYINKKGRFEDAIRIVGTSNYYLNEFIDLDSDGRAEYIRLTRYSENPRYTELSDRLSEADSRAQTVTNQYSTQNEILQRLISDGAGSASSSDLNLLIDYYLKGCTYYIEGLGTGYSPDDIVLVPNSEGTNVACFVSDPNYADILQLKAVASGGSVSSPDSLRSNMQMIYAREIAPIRSLQKDLQAQLNSIDANSGGVTRYRLDVTGFQLHSKTSQTIQLDLGTSADRLRSFFGDVNSDGLPDFITIVGTQLKVSLNTGKGFSSQVSSSLHTDDIKKVSQFNFGDVNGDGLEDLVLYNKGSQQIESYLSDGSGNLNYNATFGFGQIELAEDSSSGVYKADIGQLMVQDTNGDGFSDAVMIKLWQDKSQARVFVRNTNVKSVQEDDLISVTNGIQSSTVIYTPKHLHSNAIQAGTGDYPNLVDTSPRYLATSVRTDIGGGISTEESFSFENARFFAGTRGIARSLGFGKVREKDQGTGFFKETEYFQNDYRLAGTLISVSNYNASGKLLQQSIYSGFKFPNPFGTEISVATNIAKASFHNGNLEVSSNTSFTIDDYGFPKSQTETAGDHFVFSDIDLVYDWNGWRIGRNSRTKKYVDGTLIQDQSVVYDGDTVSSTVQFSGTSAEQITKYTYDSYGNPITSTDPAGAVTTISYDRILHIFQTEKTNALGHKEITEYETSLGLEISRTDVNGAKIRKDYDALGRVVAVFYPGSSDPNESYEYRNPARFDLSDLSSTQSVIKTVRDTTTGIETVTEEYSDPFGNIIRSVSDTAVSGIDLITDTVYDYSTGLVVKKSNPYFSNLSPFWTSYKYEDPDLRSTGSIFSDPTGNTVTSISYGILSTNTSIQYPDGSVKSFSETKNELGQTVSKTENGQTILTYYSPFGQPSRITDPSGKVTSFAYDIAGRRISVTDPNSGTITYSYDFAGRVSKQTDARNKSLSFHYDSLGRILSTIPSGGEAAVLNEYDGTDSSYGIGRLTRIVDSSGTTEIGYNIQGKPVLQKKTIDDLILITKMEYDSLGRLTAIIYPDGSKVHQTYSLNGNLERVSLDSADGNAYDSLVAEYAGPIFQDGAAIFRKTAGNGVITDLRLDPSHFRTQILSSKKEDGSDLQKISYEYDGSGNILLQTDHKNATRTRSFAYDIQNRLVSSSGSSGTLNYTYSADGNLIQKGKYTLTYGDAGHAHAVTKIYSQDSGNVTYSYDAAGNMISRNGDTLSYDSFGKLTEYSTSDGVEIRYTYDYSGNRVKTENRNASTITYSMGDLYEIVQAPGVSPKYTSYIKGLGGEILTQITRTDAVLMTEGGEQKTDIGIAGSLFYGLDFCTGAMDCGTYWKNRVFSPIYGFFTYSKLFRFGIPTWQLRIGYLCFILGVLYLTYPYYRKGNEILQRMKIAGWSSPVLLLSFFGVLIFQDCNGILTGSKKEAAPWYLLSNNASSEVLPPVSPPGKGSQGITGAGEPAVGAYFYQTDHLGSTTMLTDGYGNPIAGPGQSGTSYMSYYPYGEINYTESSGPDIFRYKFTGQIADSETGLYYYKSRYYDPFLGRFIQADDRADQGINGLNRYMYVGGNPVNRIDPDGHSWLSSALGKAGSWLQRATYISSQRWASVGNTFYNIGSAIGGALLLIGIVAFSPVLLLAGIISNPRAFQHNFGQATASYFRSLTDFGVSSIMNPIKGDPRPRYSIERGAFIVYNSYEENHGLFSAERKTAQATTREDYVAARTGISNRAMQHELVHIDQWYANSLGPFSEFEADLRSGTNGYGTWTYLQNKGLISRDLYLILNVTNIIEQMKIQSPLFNVINSLNLAKILMLH
ncbi:RHS repeat-associated core domain-containing protein [Leptospira wolffii]|uniref:RHS repeat-associated core domain-containing protein n=1 Tax=Leptospira wolffii TaxID=409998 RepID=UPI000315A681